MKHQWLEYSLTVWSATAVIGGLISWSIIGVSDHDLDFWALIAQISYGLVFSVPAFLLCLILVFNLKSRNISTGIKKVICCCFSAIVILITGKIFVPFATFWFHIIYMSTACAAIFYFKLEESLA